MRGEIIYKILASLEETAISATDLASVFISSGYGASMGKIDYEYGKKKEKRIKNQINKEKARKIKKYLSKLNGDGFLQKTSSGKIILTQKGKKRLKELKNTFSLNHSDYKKEIGENVIMISYDIPVIFNKERNILRDMLRILGFNLIQKSVWIGKVKLPKEFIIGLEKLGILDYVEILEVTKNGSLKSKN